VGCFYGVQGKNKGGTGRGKNGGLCMPREIYDVYRFADPSQSGKKIGPWGNQKVVPVVE